MYDNGDRWNLVVRGRQEALVRWRQEFKSFCPFWKDAQIITLTTFHDHRDFSAHKRSQSGDFS